MDFNKINVILASTISGFIFKSLFIMGKSIISWFSKTYPDENFITRDIGISNKILRLTYQKYNLNSKDPSVSSKISSACLGVIMFLLPTAFIIFILHLFIRFPILSVEHSPTKQTSAFWVNQDSARNLPQQEKWYLDKQICSSSKALADVSEINEATKKEVCSFFLDPIKNSALDRRLTKDIYSSMIAFPLLLLCSLYFISLSLAIFIDIYIRKKIKEYRSNEESKIYNYLT